MSGTLEAKPANNLPRLSMLLFPSWLWLSKS
jgi:hypothetical protein